MIYGCDCILLKDVSKKKKKNEQFLFYRALWLLNYNVESSVGLYVDEGMNYEGKIRFYSETAENYT